MEEHHPVGFLVPMSPTSTSRTANKTPDRITRSRSAACFNSDGLGALLIIGQVRVRRLNTNTQRHSDLIWTLVLDRKGVMILIGAVLLGLIVLVAFARRRQKA